MNPFRIVLLAAVAAAFAIGLPAITVSSGPIALGEWNKNFGDARALADANHIPMLVMWARTSCPRCSACKTAMSQDDFLAWQQERQLVMTLVHEGEMGNGNALRLIRQGNPALADLPLLCIYWLKPDGSTLLRSFIGREGNGTLPVRKGGTVAMQVAQSVDAVLAAAGWAGVDPSTVVQLPPPPPPNPRFAGGDATFRLTQYMPAGQELSLENLAGGAVKVKKLSGKLPNGIKATYDEETKKLGLAGVPTKPGTYISVWRITEKRASGSVSSDDQKITCVVESLASRNPAIGANGIKTTGFSVAADGALTGTLALQVRPNGKATVKYIGRGGKATLASRAWAGIADDGRLSVTAVGKDGDVLNAALAADGTLTGQLRLNGENGDLVPHFQLPAWSADHLATAYVGSYEAKLVSPGGGQAWTMTVKMPSGGARNGKMAYRGKLPDGRTISGNGILVESEDGKTAWLPILKAARGGTVAGLLVFDAATGALADGNLQEQQADGSLRKLAILER